MPTSTTSPPPYDVLDIFDRLDGASHDDLVRLLTSTLDRLYFLRGQAAYAATLIERALVFKGFSAYRRPFGVAQVALLTRMAKGEAEAVKFERQDHRVERAAKTAGIPTWIVQTLPDGIGTAGQKGSDGDLRAGIGYALRELLALRQLVIYEAGVARAHDIPSGPKGVRALLEEADRMLTLAADADITDLSDELRGIDRRSALRAVGATAVVTNAAFLVGHGLMFG